MKKTFKMLLLFVFIFLVVVKVDAKSMYEEEWHNYYEEMDDERYEYNYFYDVVGLNDGSIQLGITDYDISEDEYFWGGLIAKYDASGEEIWRSEKANFYFLKGVKTSDGIVV